MTSEFATPIDDITAYDPQSSAAVRIDTQLVIPGVKVQYDLGNGCMMMPVPLLCHKFSDARYMGRRQYGES